MLCLEELDLRYYAPSFASGEVTAQSETNPPGYNFRDYR